MGFYKTLILAGIVVLVLIVAGFAAFGAGTRYVLEPSSGEAFGSGGPSPWFFPSPTPAQYYPSLDLLPPNLQGRTVIQNGVTFPVCGAVDEQWCKDENPIAKGAGPFEFKWGDGSASCSWFPGEHTYNREGDFTIKVRVKNTCGFISERASSVSVHEYPILDLLPPKVYGRTVIQNGVTYPVCGAIDEQWCRSENPRASGTGPFEFKWGDANVTCAWFPVEHAYRREGDFTIKARVKNTCGFISERSSSVSI